MNYKKMNLMLLCVLSLIFIFADAIMVTMNVLLGMSLIGLGAIFIALSLKAKEANKINIMQLLQGIITLVIGGAIYLNPLLLYKILGSWFVLVAIIGIFSLIKFENKGDIRFKILLFDYVIVAVFGVFMFINTELMLDLIIKIAGLILLAHTLNEFICLKNKGKVNGIF